MCLHIWQLSPSKRLNLIDKINGSKYYLIKQINEFQRGLLHFFVRILLHAAKCYP